MAGPAVSALGGYGVAKEEKMSQEQEKKNQAKEEKCVLMRPSYTAEEAANCRCIRCRGLKLFKKAQVLA